MPIILNIGNSNTQMVEYENGRFGRIEVIPSVELNGDALPAGEVAAACVVPESKKKLRHRDVFWLDHLVRLPFAAAPGIDMSTVGADRLANLANLALNHRLPAACLDCGTAITLEMIDGGKVFRGGAIAPGRRLMAKALNDYTALLPEVELDAAILPPALSLDTRSAILSGVNRAALGAARSLAADAADGLEAAECRIIVTGGDKEFFLANLPGSVDGGEYFTLRGVADIWEMNKNAG